MWYIVVGVVGVVAGILARPYFDRAVVWAKGEKTKVATVVRLVKDDVEKL